MGFMNKRHLFSEFYFLGAEGILRFPVAGGCHADGIGYLWDVIYGLASQGQVGKIQWRSPGDMGIFSLCGGFGFLGWRFTGKSCVVALNTPHPIMFSLLPRFITFVDNFRIGQDMAVSAEALRLRGLRLKEWVADALTLGTHWKGHSGCDDYGKCQKKVHEDQISIAHAKVLPLCF